MSTPIPGEVVIEIDHPKNSPVSFSPADAAEIRSKFLTGRSGARPKHALMAFMYTPAPGQRIHLHWENRVGRITDPLGDPGAGKLLERINAVGRELKCPEYKPIEDRIFTSLTEDRLHSWLYYMLLLVEPNPIFIEDPVTKNRTRQTMPFAVKIFGEWPEKFKTSLAVRQTGRVLTFNPAMAKGELPYLPKVPKELIEAAEANELAAMV